MYWESDPHGDGPHTNDLCDRPCAAAQSTATRSNTQDQNNQNSISERLLRIELELCAEVNALSFSKPVEYVYSPIEYAFNLHALFVRKFCNSTKKVLFLGMNPGPWGMSQTGVRNSLCLKFYIVWIFVQVNVLF